MSFDEIERSNHRSQTISLFEFSVGSIQTDGTLLFGQIAWLYTSCDADIEYPAGSGRIYKSVPTDDSGAQISDDSSNDGFAITLPAYLEVPQLFVGDAPSSMIRATVRRKNLADPEAPIYWTGFVVSVDRTDDVTASVNCVDMTATLSTMGNRSYWSRTCPHALYDTMCQVDKAAYAFNAKVVSVSGDIVTTKETATAPIGLFTGGFIEWERFPGVIDRRGITLHNRQTLTLIGSAESLSEGQAITVYPGCDRTSGNRGCSRFGNISNFGGFENMPGKSPFDGNPVFY